MNKLDRISSFIYIKMNNNHVHISKNGIDAKSIIVTKMWHVSCLSKSIYTYTNVEYIKNWPFNDHNYNYMSLSVSMTVTDHQN